MPTKIGFALQTRACGGRIATSTSYAAVRPSPRKVFEYHYQLLLMLTIHLYFLKVQAF